jgi:signal transduction histidine kinase
LWIILDLVFLLIFNAIFFVLGGTENVSIWISYVFIHFAYFMLLLTPVLIRNGKSAGIFGFALYSISAVYFLIEFVAGLIFIFVSPEHHAAALLVQLCIAAFYDIILISHIIANEHTADAEQIRQYQIASINKDVSAKLKGLLGKISDKETKKKVERVYDMISSSPVQSHPNLAQMENRILQSINELEDEISAGNKERTIILAASLLQEVKYLSG